MQQHDRDPETLKIITACGPIVASTASEARDKAAEITERIPIEAALTTMSGHFNVDLTRFSGDTRLSEFGEIEGTRDMFEMYRDDGDPTLVEVAKQ